MFTMEEIKIANATSRSNGASAKNKDGSIRAIVPRYVAEHINKEDSILDFGAGKGAVHTKWLREQGFNAVAYDFGDNLIDGLLGCYHPCSLLKPHWICLLHLQF